MFVVRSTHSRFFWEVTDNGGLGGALEGEDIKVQSFNISIGTIFILLILSLCNLDDHEVG